MSRLLLIGQGNIGTFLGVALQKDNDIRHYIRNPQNLRPVVRLDFSDRRRTTQKIKRGAEYKYPVLTDIAAVRDFDYVLVPVSHLQWKNALTSLRPFLEPGQRLVLLGNVWDTFDWLEQEIPVPYLFAFPNFGGAIIDGKLKGWLTPNLTTGVTNPAFAGALADFNCILEQAGFRPRVEPDIRGWLMTHFAWNAGLMGEAARQDGFRNMTRKWSSLMDMFRLIQECMQIAQKTGVDIRRFPEGRKAFYPRWWNALKIYLLFLLPGMADNADAAMNREEWLSYARALFSTAKAGKVNMSLLQNYQ